MFVAPGQDCPPGYAQVGRNARRQSGALSFRAEHRRCGGEESPGIVIPSGGPKGRRRGIAVVPTEGSLYRDDGDSSPPGLRPYARNDTARRFLALRSE